MLRKCLSFAAVLALVTALPALSQGVSLDPSPPVPEGFVRSAAPATSPAELFSEATMDVNADYVQTFAGTTVNGPTWNRPANMTTLDSSCTACRYSVQTFVLQATSHCNIVSTQDYDGHIALYRGSFAPVLPLTGLVDLDDDAELGRGTSRIPSSLSDTSIELTAGTYHLVSSAYSNAYQGSFTNTVRCESSQPLQGTCFFTGVPREKNVCFFNRFIVLIHDVSNTGGDGIATPVRFGSQESAFFWFYSDQNFEVMLKVLNGCGVNNHWWVFAGALTNQQYHIEIYDHKDGSRKHYWNLLGTNAPAVTDTTAFTCP